MVRLCGKRSLICFAFFLFVCAPFHAYNQNKPVTAEPGGPVPLIDRELFFNYPEIRNVSLSPDGRMIAFLKPSRGIMNIWVKKTDEPMARASVLTTSEESLDKFMWTADSRYIVFAHSIWGNDMYNVYAVEPGQPVDTLSGTPNVRNLTPQDSTSTVLYGVSRKNPDLAWVGVRRQNNRWYDLYTLEISTGNLRLMKKNHDSISRWMFDWDENPGIGIRYRASDSTQELLRFQNDGRASKIFDCPATEICEPIGFSPDNQSVYLKTNKGENQDFAGLARLQLGTGKVTMLEQDPANKVDLDEAFQSPSTHRILFTSYIDDRVRMYWQDSSLEEDHHLLAQKFPGKDIRFISFPDNDSLFLFSTESDDKIAQVYLFDRSRKQFSSQFALHPALKPYEAQFSKMAPLVYQSSDGTNISAYLTLPRGVAPKNLPVIILPHDGPWMRDFRQFNPLVQWLANRGYGVLQMNYRGSAGFGRKFLGEGRRQWSLLMQDDITWGVNELIGRGIADPKRIGIMGFGYGGYAALAGLTFTSDLYAAGVDIDGPSNLLSTYQSIPAGWSGTRTLFQHRVGDTATNAEKNRLVKQSPSFSDTAIRSPLLIVYGQANPLVTKNENDRIVVTLRDSGRNVEYLTLENDAYPYADVTNEMAVFAKVEGFLGKTLHGRTQESVKTETAKRLKEIQVDPEKVTVGVGVPVLAMQELPKPAADLSAGNYNYAILVEVPGRKVPLAMNRMIISDSMNNWVVTDRITGQTGDQADEAVYQKGNLHLVSRKTQQRGKTAEYSFNGTEITSTLPDKTQTVSVDGAYLHNGAGLDLMIARLPLKEGYASGFYMIGDDGRPRLYQVKVTGRDTLNNEPCLKVELTNADNTGISTMLWINMKHKMAYRMIIPLAALPGSRMTIALNQQPSLPGFLLFLWVITPVHGI